VHGLASWTSDIITRRKDFSEAFAIAGISAMMAHPL